MASAKEIFRKMDLSSPKVGVMAVAVEGVAGFGASYAIGRVYTQYGDKWWGKNIARLAAAVGKLGAMLAFGHAGHPTMLSAGLNTIGQAGINAVGLGMGLDAGRKKMGKKALIVPADANIKAIPGATDMTQIGALGKASPGKGLSWDQIEELAAGH